GSQMRSAAASAATAAGRYQSGDTQAKMTARASAPPIDAASTVGATTTDAAGSDALTSATRSRPASSGWTASAMRPSMIIGWASAISGVAATLLNGATRLTRPNTHATIGAEQIVTTVVPTTIAALSWSQRGSRWIPTRWANRPAAIIDVTPTTLN